MWVKSFGAALMLVAVVGVGTTALWRFLDTPVELVRIAGDLTEIERQEIRAAVIETLINHALAAAGGAPAIAGAGVAAGAIAGAAAAAFAGAAAAAAAPAIVAAIESLGWTRDTRVRRIGSGVIDVSVKREALAARWGNAEYVTTAGEVVGAPGLPDQEETLPTLSGAFSTSGEAMQVYGKLSARLAGLGLTLKSLEETEVGGWRLILDDDVTVLLGSRDINGRLDRVLAVYADALTHQMHKVDRIDARYGSGVAVRWRDELAEETLLARN